MKEPAPSALDIQIPRLKPRGKQAGCFVVKALRGEERVAKIDLEITKLARKKELACDVGYLKVKRKHRGKGYGKALGGAVFTALFEDQRIKRVTTNLANERSALIIDGMLAGAGIEANDVMQTKLSRRYLGGLFIRVKPCTWEEGIAQLAAEREIQAAKTGPSSDMLMRHSVDVIVDMERLRSEISSQPVEDAVQ